MWPLVVDGFIVVASLSVVRAVADRRRAAYPWLLVLTFSTISVAFNVVHAAPTVVARFVAAIPPAALVLSFELLMRQLRQQLNSNPAPSPRDTDPQLAASPAAARTAIDYTSSWLAPRAGKTCSTKPDTSARTKNGTAPDSPEKHSPRLLGISDGYARRLLRELIATPPWRPDLWVRGLACAPVALGCSSRSVGIVGRAGVARPIQLLGLLYDDRCMSAAPRLSFELGE